MNLTFKASLTARDYSDKTKRGPPSERKKILSQNFTNIGGVSAVMGRDGDGDGDGATTGISMMGNLHMQAHAPHSKICIEYIVSRKNSCLSQSRIKT